MKNSQSQQYNRQATLLPITLIKEYYWCPTLAYLKLHLWSERPTHSMQAGKQVKPTTQEIKQKLEQKQIKTKKILQEHPVTSRRLGLTGRPDYIAITTNNTLAIIEAKLSISKHKLNTKAHHIQAQLTAYTIAAEETLRKPAEHAYIYSTEQAKLIELRITPTHRQLVETAAKHLHEMLLKEQPPIHPPPRKRCTACSYKSICPTYHRI